MNLENVLGWIFGMGVVLPAAICGVLWVAARCTGWHGLAGKYTGRGAIQIWRRMAFCFLGNPGTRMFFKVGAVTDGLVLAPRFPWWPFFRPVAVPWDNIIYRGRLWLVWTWDVWVIDDVTVGLPVSVGRRLDRVKRGLESPP